MVRQSRSCPSSDLPERSIVDERQRRVGRDQIVVPLHRVRREIGDPDAIRLRREADGEDAVRIARVVDAQPFLAIGRRHGFVVGPAVRIGGVAAIGDAQLDLAAGAARHAEVEPLVEIGPVILDDFQVGAVAVLLHDADIACVERARNRQCHGTFLRKCREPAPLIVRGRGSGKRAGTRHGVCKGNFTYAHLTTHLNMPLTASL